MSRIRPVSNVQLHNNIVELIPQRKSTGQSLYYYLLEHGAYHLSTLPEPEQLWVLATVDDFMSEQITTLQQYNSGMNLIRHCMAQTAAYSCKDRPERLAWLLKKGNRVLFEAQQNLVFLIQRFKTDASLLSDILAKVPSFEQDIQSTAILILIEYEHQRQLETTISHRTSSVLQSLLEYLAEQDLSVDGHLEIHKYLLWIDDLLTHWPSVNWQPVRPVSLKYGEVARYQQVISDMELASKQRVVQFLLPLLFKSMSHSDITGGLIYLETFGLDERFKTYLIQRDVKEHHQLIKTLLDLKGLQYIEDYLSLFSEREDLRSQWPTNFVEVNALPAALIGSDQLLQRIQRFFELDQIITRKDRLLTKIQTWKNILFSYLVSTEHNDESRLVYILEENLRLLDSIEDIQERNGYVYDLIHLFAFRNRLDYVKILDTRYAIVHPQMEVHRRNISKKEAVEKSVYEYRNGLYGLSTLKERIDSADPWDIQHFIQPLSQTPKLPRHNDVVGVLCQRLEHPDCRHKHIEYRKDIFLSFLHHGDTAPAVSLLPSLGKDSREEMIPKLMDYFLDCQDDSGLFTWMQKTGSIPTDSENFTRFLTQEEHLSTYIRVLCEDVKHRSFRNHVAMLCDTNLMFILDRVFLTKPSLFGVRDLKLITERYLEQDEYPMAKKWFHRTLDTFNKTVHQMVYSKPDLVSLCLYFEQESTAWNLLLNHTPKFELPHQTVLTETVRDFIFESLTKRLCVEPKSKYAWNTFDDALDYLHKHGQEQLHEQLLFFAQKHTKRTLNSPVVESKTDSPEFNLDEMDDYNNIISTLCEHKLSPSDVRSGFDKAHQLILSEEDDEDDRLEAFALLSQVITKLEEHSLDDFVDDVWDTFVECDIDSIVLEEFGVLFENLQRSEYQHLVERILEDIPPIIRNIDDEHGREGAQAEWVMALVRTGYVPQAEEQIEKMSISGDMCEPFNLMAKYYAERNDLDGILRAHKKAYTDVRTSVIEALNVFIARDQTDLALQLMVDIFPKSETSRLSVYLTWCLLQFEHKQIPEVMMTYQMVQNSVLQMPDNLGKLELLYQLITTGIQLQQFDKVNALWRLSEQISPPIQTIGRKLQRLQLNTLLKLEQFTVFLERVHTLDVKEQSGAIATIFNYKEYSSCQQEIMSYIKRQYLRQYKWGFATRLSRYAECIPLENIDDLHSLCLFSLYSDDAEVMIYRLFHNSVFEGDFTRANNLLSILSTGFYREIGVSI